MLWQMPLGELWVNASYDYLLPFGARPRTNSVVLVLMDNVAYDRLGQDRDVPWDRGLHAELVNRLADDGCAMVVFDAFFKIMRDPEKDAALMQAMRRTRVVIMAEQAEVTRPGTVGAYPVFPAQPFLEAAQNRCGVAWLDPDLDKTVRRHWPFPSPGPYESLPWVVAKLAGAQLSENPRERWLRYYPPGETWTRLSYAFALQHPGYFKDKIVFIGNWPHTTVPGDEKDEYKTPHTRWTGESVGGVELMITSFLNLLNGEWLERPAWWIEGLAILVSGALLGGTLCRLRPRGALTVGMVIVVLVGFGAVWLTYHTRYWFPWLVIAGGQVPCALGWALIMPAFHRVRETITEAGSSSRILPEAPRLPPAIVRTEELPVTPDYELIHPPFGEGAYGKVWLARNAVGQWQALKVVYLANFQNSSGPYDREFSGISKYKPLSDKHPGLLRVDFVSRQREGYFYYVMELGDSIEPGWEKEPARYKPRDLVSERARSPGHRLPVRECIRIGLILTDALEFLHGNGLIHRDIKPQNIIFVGDQPKLADVGLISDIRPGDKERTFVGTPGYMPPPPERPGTAQADIYALGMVLYVISTGRDAAFFPNIATTLVNADEPTEFMPLNRVILKACNPDIAERYNTAHELRQGLGEVQAGLEPAD